APSSDVRIVFPSGHGQAYGVPLRRTAVAAPMPPTRLSFPSLVSYVNGRFMQTGDRSAFRLVCSIALSVFTLVLSAGTGWGAEGAVTWGGHGSLTPAFFDTADAEGAAPPLVVDHAIPDAPARPLPAHGLAAHLS